MSSSGLLMAVDDDNFYEAYLFLFHKLFYKNMLKHLYLREKDLGS